MANRTFKSGTDRGQGTLLPPQLDDYVDRGNPVRAIDAFVDRLDLVSLGFLPVRISGGPGQPAFHPRDLLKLYIYGYLNRVRSTRRLAREARINLEVIWLLRGLTPGYRTIGDFRADNRNALKEANRQFVLMMRDLGLVGGDLVAVDGAFFHGDASKGSIVTANRLEGQLASVERDIQEYQAAVERDVEAYDATLDANDAAETSTGVPEEPTREDVAGKVTALLEKRAEVKTDLARLAETGETQVSRTDPDARLLTKRGHVVAGYNVQIAVDDKHKLIVASDVVNDGNDTGQLHRMALAAKEALGVETLQVLGDAGYFNGETLQACETDGIVAYVPEPDRNQRLAAQGRFTAGDFVYDAAADVYRCPAGSELPRMGTLKLDQAGKQQIRYASRSSVCRACPLRPQCLSPKAKRRDVYRWVHHDVIERHRARIAGAKELMRRRGAIVEHPFGTLKCRAGYRHFLLRGFSKVRGEWSLMALCYNFGRVLEIIGVDGFLAYLAKRHPHFANLLLNLVLPIAYRIWTRVSRFLIVVGRNRLTLGFVA